MSRPKKAFACSGCDAIVIGFRKRAPPDCPKCGATDDFTPTTIYESERSDFPELNKPRDIPGQGVFQWWKKEQRAL